EESVDGDHHVGGLDDRISLLAALQLQLLHGCIGDRSRHHGTTDIDFDMGGGCPFGDIDDLAFEYVARTNFHEKSSGFSRLNHPTIPGKNRGRHFFGGLGTSWGDSLRYIHWDIANEPTCRMLPNFSNAMAWVFSRTSRHPCCCR